MVSLTRGRERLNLEGIFYARFITNNNNNGNKTTIINF